jgi:ABC-type bacteriocin/lantibiotic exporter with double-glycine peptidase domain
MLAIVFVVQAASAGLGSIQPLFFQRIVSLVVSRRGAFPMADGLRLLGSLTAVYLAAALLQALGGYVASSFSSGLLRELQVDFFDRISRLPLQRLQKQSAGELFTRFSADTSQAQRFLASFLPSVTRDALTALVVTVILWSACPLILTGTALLIVAVTGVFTAGLHFVMEHFARTQRAQYGAINTLLDETIQGIDTLKTLASEERRGRYFETLAREFRDVSVKAGGLGATLTSGLDLLSKLGGILLIALAYRLLAGGSLATNAFLLFFFYAGLLQMAVSSLVYSLATFQPQLVGLQNIARFFAEPVEDEQPQESSVPAPAESVAIELTGLTFGYPEGRLLFREADLVVPAKSITLVHGPSGSGKSTLINLLLRFYAPQCGNILLGDIPIDTIARAELRRTIGVVLQDHFIFSESLRDNIRIADPAAGDDRIEDALRRAHLESFLARLPGGLNCRLDPRGKGLSGGERQRICIARVLLRDAAIMVLDEPWSNLDDEARGTLALVLNECRARKTILIMSHEDIPSLEVDRVFLLVPETGRFVEESREGPTLANCPPSATVGLLRLES